MANDGLVGESLIRMGSGGGNSRPPNTYPLWRYVMLVVVIGIGCIYALPNLFPDDHALQVRPNAAGQAGDVALLERAASILESGDVAVHGRELNDGTVLLRVADNPA